MSRLLFETISFTYNILEVFTLDNNESHKRSIFAKRLTYLRQKNGYTQETFANKAGFSRGRYANYEQGRREPDFEIVKLFAGILNCSTDYLLGISNSVSSYPYIIKDSTLDYNIKPATEKPNDLIQFLEQSEVLFHGIPLTEEDKAKIKAFLEIVFWDAKLKNKRKKS